MPKHDAQCTAPAQQALAEIEMKMDKTRRNNVFSTFILWKWQYKIRSCLTRLEFFCAMI